MTSTEARGSSLRCGSLDEFAAAVQDLPVPWAVDTRSKRFSASLETRRIGALHFADVRFGPCSAKRSRGASAPDSHMCLTLQRHGRQGMFWADRDVVIRPGEIILWDDTRPMRLENDGDARSYNFWFPTRLAEQRVGSIRNAVRMKAEGSHGVAKIISRHLETVLEESDNLSDLQQSRMLDTAVDLISLCFSDSLFAPEKPSNLSRIAGAAKRLMLDASDLDDLTPRSVAAQIGTSVRNLQLAFAGENTTFSTFILSTRLERAKSALLSDTFSSFSITDIAHWFGFFDASHFNRAFKRAYGANPSSVRAGRK